MKPTAVLSICCKRVKLAPTVRAEHVKCVQEIIYTKGSMNQLSRPFNVAEREQRGIQCPSLFL